MRAVGISLVIVVLTVIAVDSQTNSSRDSLTDIQKIKDEAFQKYRFPAAKFDHDKHARVIKCYRCHHVYEDGEHVPGKNSVGRECSACHKAGGGEVKLKYAYHTKCIGCHLESDKGPVMCKNCHNSKMHRIKEEAYNTPERPYSLFDHELHVKSEVTNSDNCSVCHHMYKKTSMLSSQILGQECSSCHLKNIQGGKNRLPLRQSYHSQCLGCHKKINSGPLACGECHRE